MSALPEERLGQLRVAKLRALLGDRVDAATTVHAAPFGTGAALLGADGAAWFLIEQAGPRSLGGALTWAVRKGATRLTVIVDAGEAVAARLAREGSWFDLDVAVERVVGTATVAVAAGAVEPLAPMADGLPPGLDPAIAALLAAAEVDVVVEHGTIKAEVRGLEVARVVTADGAPRLEVGVGRFDREISAMMFANVPTAEALDKAVDMVRRYRAPGATTHPLRDLVPERWLRELLLADPGAVGAGSLRRVDTTLEPESLREPQPAAAVGPAADGHTIVAVCTAGVDLDVVALAADTRAAVDPDAELVICGPERILIDATRAVAAHLERPARFVPLELPH